MKRSTIALIAVAGLATAVSAQPAASVSYQLTSSNDVDPLNPTTTISISAIWVEPTGWYVFGAANYDLNASSPGFTSGGAVDILLGPGATVGTWAASGLAWTGGANGQLHIPPLNFIGSQDNPILMATYEWTTTDFTIRTVDLTTSNTTNYLLAEWGPPPLGGRTFQQFPDNFTPGAGSFEVTPAPSALALLG
ncbi:MAG: hypothetical protein IH985_07625, partial [Planctomycetes bacterium]|nr:hypothetical protein [Planctomycetota bacterium]